MQKADPEAGEGSPADSLSADYPSTTAIVLRLMRECMLPNWQIVATAAAGMAVIAATAGALPFLIQRLGDDVFVGKDPFLVFILPSLVLLVMCVRAVADWVSTVAEGRLGAKIVSDLRIRMFQTIAAADLAWLQRTHSGRFVSSFVNDVVTVDWAATKVFSALFKNAISVVLLVGAMFYMDWRLTLLVLIGSPIALLNLTRQKSRIKRSVSRSLKEYGDLGSMLTQTLQSMRVVKAYSQEDYEARRFRQIVENVRTFLMKTQRSRALVGPVSETMTGLGLAAAMFYGGWQGIYGNVSLGHFMGFLTAAMLAFQPMRAVATAQATLSEGLLAASRVFALIDHAR